MWHQNTTAQTLCDVSEAAFQAIGHRAGIIMLHASLASSVYSPALPILVRLCHSHNAGDTRHVFRVSNSTPYDVVPQRSART